jgi:hypothetical protein
VLQHGRLIFPTHGELKAKNRPEAPSNHDTLGSGRRPENFTNMIVSSPSQSMQGASVAAPMQAYSLDQLYCKARLFCRLRWLGALKPGAAYLSLSVFSVENLMPIERYFIKFGL